MCFLFSDLCFDFEVDVFFFERDGGGGAGDARKCEGWASEGGGGAGGRGVCSESGFRALVLIVVVVCIAVVIHR